MAQHQLIFDKGLTNVPSDNICSDNALSECIGLAYADGDHFVIQDPERFIDFSSENATLVYVHKFQNQERFIAYSNEDNSLKAYTKDGTTPVQLCELDHNWTTSSSITNVGKTIVVADDNGINYFIWKESNYRKAGELPKLDVSFSIVGFRPVYVSSKADGMFRNTDSRVVLVDGKQDDFNNLVTGLYAEAKNKAAKARFFTRPFFARAALELYDGSFTMATAPVLLFPCVNKNCWLRVPRDNDASLGIMTSYLFAKVNSDYEELSDIVKDVVIFVTDGIEVNKTDEDCPFDATTEDDVVANGITAGSEYTSFRFRKGMGYAPTMSVPDSGMYIVFNPRDEGDIIADMSTNAVFYKLCSLGIRKTTDYIPTLSLIAEHTLENITTQDQLDGDEYFSFCPLFADRLYSYNGRLNMCGVSRGFFGGHHQFYGYSYVDEDKNATYYLYNIVVTINTDFGEKKVVSAFVSPERFWGDRQEKPFGWFYYPDPRAVKADIYVYPEKNTPLVSFDLKEHSLLHGAYYMGTGLPRETNLLLPDKYTPVQPDSTPTVFIGTSTFDTSPEPMVGDIVTSEVNNPFVFNPEGYNRVGTGRVLAMATQTQALSQGQFGAYPLLVFTTEGIWAMQVDETGLYKSVRPMSREVICNSASLIETDNAVFFASKKGLMAINGSQVTCVSQQLSGRYDYYDDTGILVQMDNLGPFAKFLEGAVMAYDYRDSLIWMFNPNIYNPIIGGRDTMCYIYSIRGASFSKFKIANIDDESPKAITSVIPNYPDFILQNEDNVTFSLIDRPDINDDLKEYTGMLMLTRPMKLGNGFALKTIMQIRHIANIDEDSYIGLDLYASNDIKHWAKVTSLTGIPWKYYRIVMRFKFQATDRYSGSVIITQERRTDRLR